MKYVLFGFIVLNMVACTSQKESYTQEQLYEKMSSGVVLVQNTYNYEVSNEKYSSFYILTTRDRYTCHKYDNQTHDSIKENYNNTIYGTGFFLNNKQTVVTNSHVINPKIDTIQLYNSIKAYLINEIEKYTKLLEASLEYKSFYTKQLADNKSLPNHIYSQYKERINEYDKCIQVFERHISDELLKELQDKDFEKNYKIRIDAQIGIALNGSKILSNKDFGVVTVIKDVPNYDLGIIAPFGITSYVFSNSDENYKNRYVFKLPNETNNSKNNEELKLYMIGFNRGPNLALTNEGIKAQITQGNISQNTDSIKIMYSIPALQGSSGSPVVNQYGELVAVNFAGISTTQGFNYGIKAERLKEILDDTGIQERINAVNRQE
ncbi:S1 family peptidase [Bacteroides uniformis]|uniref:S1 family peptidase n=1 Tax=Bacteroides uniformis TaxID=820 RepID=UPI0039B4565B